MRTFLSAPSALRITCRLNHCESYKWVRDWEEELAARLNAMGARDSGIVRDAKEYIMARWIDNADLFGVDGKSMHLTVAEVFCHARDSATVVPRLISYANSGVSAER